jgi:hypothetical protein
VGDHDLGMTMALALTALVHLAGATVLIWLLLDGERIDWRGILRPGRDDGGDGGPPPDEPTPTAPHGGGDPLPLPDAVSSAVRLRAPARIADAHPRPQRRPGHPDRAPERNPR